MFQIGEYVVYGSTGVCKVVDIGPMNLPGVDRNRKYYTLEPAYSKGSKVFTPVDNNKNVIRPILTEDEAKQLIEEIDELENIWIKDEKNRELQYREVLQTCDCREAFRIIKTLYSRKMSRIAEGKKVTASDQNYLHIAEDRVYGELAIALSRPKEKMAEYITECIAKKEQALVTME
ncbi:MAG: CarD family transcriptional regulator [Lachnospiraceae bacterium]|nr:CarD family transcriptional regulator [Lachnospiraceae bacterium]